MSEVEMFEIRKLVRQLRDLREGVYRGVLEIPSFKVIEGDPPGASQPGYDDSGWADFQVGETWGGYDVVAWFRTTVAVPDSWRDGKLALRFQAGPRDGGGSTAEALLYVDGAPLQGIDIWHDEAMLPCEVAARGTFQIALRAWSGVLAVPAVRRFKVAELVWIDEPTERLYYLANTLVKAARELPEDDLRRARLLDAVDGGLRRLDLIKPGSGRFYASAAAAEAWLRAEVERLAGAGEMRPAVTGIGHSHLDMAWLWRLQHSIDKASRTFSTALNLMRHYPEYHFMHSSPQLYKLLAEQHPGIYRDVKERIAEGRWEITGGMWVEADSNLTSGESLVRQFLLGKRLIEEEFGTRTTVLWLPDAFGFSAALPQIALKSGFRFFVTSKLSWNQFNRFPYDTFRWRGIDGSEILAHLVTTPEGRSLARHTYNGQLMPEDVKGLWDQYRQKEINDELLMLFGWGDGGGGPTKEMLESARVLRDLPGFPRVHQEPAEAFFARLERRLGERDVPAWDGELYLEYHRGTYTSQAQVKRANRQAEVMYHDAEALSALACVLTGEHPYPRAGLREGWEAILLNQFHDILPGSSIGAVYEDCANDYCRIFDVGETAIQSAQRAIAVRMPAEAPGVLVFNGLSWSRDGLVSLPWSEVLDGKTLRGPDGQPARAQIVGEGDEKRLLVWVGGVPALGYRLYPVCDAPRLSGGARRLIVTPTALENEYYRIALDERGHITSLFDKRGAREVVPPGARANVLQAFEDRPMDFDAWDIDIYYREKMVEVADLVEAVVEETGPVRGTLRLTWRFYDSTIVQRLTLYDGSPRIDFRTQVDWQERQVLLKVAFPVDVRATKATYDIQFGAVERPTHENTSWDRARFEVAGHKWADLSEGDYGVALLNDCKYGHDTHDNVLRLSLIKSAVDPDPEADRGRHTFTYSLLPHRGGWRTSEVVPEGYALNNPLRVIPITGAQRGDLPVAYSQARVDAAHVIVETIKQAEDGDSWIVRVYESRQYRNTSVRLTFGKPVRRAVECNLVEEGEAPIDWEGDTLTFPIAPFEIKTFRVWF